MKYGHEDLIVWQKAVDYAVAVLKKLDAIDLPRKHFRFFEQLESSVISVASNIIGDISPYELDRRRELCWFERASK